MNRIKKLFWAALASASAFVSTTCAPVDQHGSAEDKPQSTAQKPDDKSPIGDELPQPEEVKEPAHESTEKVDPVRQRIEMAIEQIRQRDLLTTHGFWTIFHGILGLGPSVTLLNQETGKRVNAVDHICDGGELRGLEFIPTRYGLDVRTGPQFVGQGHQDQFVAEMTQWGMSIDRKFVVAGRDYTFRDFVRHSQMRARTNAKANQELSWAIVIIGQYLGTDVEWTNSFKERLKFEDLVRYELKAPVVGAACGGTHRLFGLTWVYHLHLRKGGKTTGVWKDVAGHTAKYQKLARKLQNSDGSFSTNFFAGRGNASDKQLRINTTGHILEWLALSLSDTEIKKPWVQDAANALALMILDIRGSAMEGGTLYHAAHGLLLYYSRVYGAEGLGLNKPVLPLPPK
jgi:hypothetical protein